MKAWLASLRKSNTAQGMILGLYLSRVAAETSAEGLRWLILLPIALGGIVAGLGLAAALRRIAPRTWPIFALAAYVIYPQANSLMALAIGGAALVMLIALNAHPLPRSPWLEIGVFLAALMLYVGTLAPTILPADSGEFQLVSAVLGIAHPPGYPLYTMLGRLFTLLPIGEIAWRVNLYGAVCGALTLAVIARSVRRAVGSTSATLIAVGALGLTATYWAQSTTANIRTLTALLTALSLARLLRWGETRSRRDLIAFAVCFGLGVGHHASIGLLGFPFLAYILVADPRIVLQPKRWGGAALALIASLAVLAYLPLRSLMGSSFDSSPIRTWDAFVTHVLALGFGGDFLHYRTWNTLAPRAGVWVEIMRLQFGAILPWTMLLAVWPTARSNWRTLLLLGGTWAINTLAAITYRAPQTVEYLIPSYVALAMLLGYGLGLAQRAWPRWANATVVAGLALLAASNGVANWPSYHTLRQDTSARDYAEAILRDAPADALILSSWHRATPFWYLQQVEGMRPDVEVTYVYPEGATPNEQVWLRRIGEEIDQRPVIVTNWFYAYEGVGYHWLPLHDAWLASREPLNALPAQAMGSEASFEEGIRILGYELAQDTLTPGDAVELTVYWQPTQPLARDYSTFAQLIGPGGVVGQGDVAHRSREYLVGEVRADHYRFALLLHTPPGEYQLITGFYYSDGNGWMRLTSQGQDHIALTTLAVRPRRESAATLHPLRLDFDGGLRLTGVDFDRGVAGQTRLYLHWRGRADSSQATVRLLTAKQIIAEAALPALRPGEAATLALDMTNNLAEVEVQVVRDGGEPLGRFGPWHRRTSAGMRLELPRSVARYVPLGGEMAFVGLGQSPSQAIAGQEAYWSLNFLTLRPLLADYSMSFGVTRPDVGWEQKSDGTPALGAIPTLKWVRGWRVTDPRRITLLADAPRGEATLTLTVYDAFTLQPLSVLDERLVRQGQGTTLHVGAVPIE